VSLVDLMPTLADLAGAPLDGLDGASLLPLADGSEQGDRTILAAGTDGGAVSQLAVRTPPWKLIRHVGSGAEEAYRVDLDPRELENRADEAPADLRERAETELLGTRGGAPSPEDAAAVEKRLADLGYL
jgi:arylsulfatase A-like enzyme